MAVSAAQDEKKKALNLAIAQIEKSYGRGAIMKMGPDAPKVRVECIPTGAINLDAAIGAGGIPRGRITEIITPAGKTEPVLARISWDELDSLVPLIADIIATDDPERISHIPSFFSQGHIPGPVAWAYLQKYLRDDDAAWTFGEGETGLLITRNNQPFCFVYVQRPFKDL